MIVDGKRYVLGGLPGSDWAANASAAGEVELQQGRNTERVRMVELPPDEARPLLRLFPVEVPTGVGFMKNAGLVTGPNPDEYEALAGRCPVFRLDLLALSRAPCGVWLSSNLIGCGRSRTASASRRHNA